MDALAAETSRASERNRDLERELALSVARVSSLQQALAKSRMEATTDGLTGLLNRRAFDARLRRAIVQHQADHKNAFALLLLDIDHFKRFNHLHGHHTGDQVLRLVSRQLLDNVKGRDTAARYGGEEFAILLVGADLDAGKMIAEQLRARLAKQSLVKRGTGETLGQVHDVDRRRDPSTSRGSERSHRAGRPRLIRSQAWRTKSRLCRSLTITRAFQPPYKNPLPECPLNAFARRM